MGYFMGDLEQISSAEAILNQIQAEMALNNEDRLKKQKAIEDLNHFKSLSMKANFVQLRARFQALISSLLKGQLSKVNFTKTLTTDFNMSLEQAFTLFKDEFGYSHVQRALLNNDFTRAEKLIQFGAPLRHGERECLEIAFASNTPVTIEFSPKDINPQAQPTKLPAIKEFGLTLGIYATAQDGTLSQFGHVGPTYHLMTDSVSLYASNLNQSHPDSEYFKEMSEAFAYSDQACQFQYSTSQAQAGQMLAERVKAGKLTSVPTSCQGHAMAMTIVPNEQGGAYLVFTNRGVGASANDFGTQIYAVDDLSKLDADFMQAMANGHSNGTAHADIMRKIKEVVNPKEPVQTINQKGQKNDNCTIANPRANLHGVLMCQKAIQAKKPVSAMTDTEVKSVKESYQSFKLGMRQQKVHDLAERLSKDPMNLDLQTLASAYLTQHPDRSEPQLQQLLESHSNTEVSVNEPRTVTMQFDHKKQLSKESASPSANPNLNNPSSPKIKGR